jgi:hypothetical protein
MKSLFVRDGRLTFLSEILLVIFVLLGFFGIPILGVPIWLAIPLGLISLLSAVLLISEGAAVSVGLKPFTNDPLGWRKAKNTYQAKDTPSTEKKSADDRP